MQSWLFETNKNIEYKIKYAKNNPEQFMDVAAVKVLPENARDFFPISYFDAKNAQRSQWAGQKKGLCCALRHLCDSLQTPVHVPGDVQITLGIPVQTSPWHSLQVFVTQWSEKSYFPNHVIWLFWCGSGFSIVAVIFVKGKRGWCLSLSWSK